MQNMNHFQTLFYREAIYDKSVLEELPQYHIHQHCDYRPTDEEIRAATLKCLVYHQETFFLLKTEILQFWDFGTVPNCILELRIM